MNRIFNWFEENIMHQLCAFLLGKFANCFACDRTDEIRKDVHS